MIVSQNELNQKLKNADKVEYFNNPGMNEKTRSGSYVRISKGLSVKDFFVGFDKVNNVSIIEHVG